ncbi:peptidase S53, partial [Lentilactobacillus kefiri]|nr:peptidase S53 [Lentilactobacillus kefiri]
MIGGSGGGFAHFYRTPSYQIGIPGINTFHARQYFSYSLLPINGTPPLLSGKDYGRNYPDISANMMGYQVYQQDGKDSWGISG